MFELRILDFAVYQKIVVAPSMLGLLSHKSIHVLTSHVARWERVLKCICGLTSPFHQFRLLVTLAGRRNETWDFPPGRCAKPKSRQCIFGGASAMTSFGESWSWGRREMVDPSGFVPGVVDLGSCLETQRGRRTKLQSRSIFWGSLCKSPGPGCNFFSYMDPTACCTMDKQL